MTTNAILILILMFAAGLALGAFYFVSLWKTVQKLPQTKNRGLLLIGSFVLRLSVVLAASYFLLRDGHWERLAAAMIGFIVMRKILTYRLGPREMAAVHE